MKMEGIESLRKYLKFKRERVLTRYDFYDMKYKVPNLRWLDKPEINISTVLGWCGTAVDSIADRLHFYEFADDNFDINEIFDRNNKDIFVNDAILSALISSCSFAYIKKDKDTGYPRIQIIDGANATGVLDPVTYLLKEGYAVLERDKNDVPIVEAYFLPDKTYVYEKGKKETTEYDNPTGYPLLVPIIHRPHARRPFGISRISRACMDAVKAAVRTLNRAELSAEFYSFPQRYLLGVSETLEGDEKWKAVMSAMLTITKDEDGEKPTIGQFPQASMQPYNDQLKTQAAIFAGETGLTLQDLGFIQDNPTSADAIKASHDILNLKALKAQEHFGVGLLNTGFVAACLRDDFKYKREILYLTKPVWGPTFAPDASSLSMIGDGIIKLNQAIPGAIGKKEFKVLTGIEING